MRKEVYEEIGEPGKVKILPKKYKESILKALTYYPELENVRIYFKLVTRHNVPYSTQPAVASIFKPRNKRTYEILILEKAKEPMRSALLKNLPQEEQIAVIAHELVHVIQFHSCNVMQLIKTILTYPIPFIKKKLERGADKGAIE